MAKLSRLDKEMLDRLKEVYHSGGQDIEVCKALGISLKEFNYHYEQSEDFAELIDMGRLYAKAWWHEQGRKNIQNTKFNTTLWSFHMKNLYGWADKTESVTMSRDEPETLDEAYQELKKLMPGTLKKLFPGLTEAEILEKTSGMG